MIETIKLKLGNFILNNIFIKDNRSSIFFNNFISRSTHYIILPPENAEDLNFAIKIIEYLNSKAKQIYLFLPEGKEDLYFLRYEAKSIF
ncbi:hypothetical protein ACFLS9_10195, partial [Bacteroidota bacterium]